MSFGFDFSDVKAEEPRDNGPLAAGVYTVAVNTVEMKNGKKEGSKYLKIMFKVCDMESHNGAVIFDNITTVNAIEQAQNIGRSRIKSMFLLSGCNENQLATVEPKNLIGKKFSVFVKIEQNEGYSASNKVTSISAAPDHAKNITVNTAKDAPVPKWM